VPAVDVVAVEAEADNPMGWPYLLTRGLTGRPLLEFVQRPSYLDWQAALLATGDYLAASHSITFDASGYIVSPDGPAPDRAGRPLHTVHDPAEEQAAALSDLVLARHFLDADLADDLAGRFHVIGETIAPEYDPPRFVHAAFHPNHPHVERSGGVLRVSGCVDMESASAGAVFDDLTTLAIGMMVGARGVAWWEPLFEGYGKAPDLERFRMALLATCFYCFGEEHALQDVQSTYRALLAAETWAELFGANRSAASA
jgi:hypothetical protein